MPLKFVRLQLTKRRLTLGRSSPPFGTISGFRCVVLACLWIILILLYQCFYPLVLFNTLTRGDAFFFLFFHRAVRHCSRRRLLFVWSIRYLLPSSPFIRDWHFTLSHLTFNDSAFPPGLYPENRETYCIHKSEAWCNCTFLLY